MGKIISRALLRQCTYFETQQTADIQQSNKAVDKMLVENSTYYTTYTGMLLTKQRKTKLHNRKCIEIMCFSSFNSQNVFTSARGSRPNVKKILIVITDGISHDRNRLPNAADLAKRKQIVRFAIGVSCSVNSNV